MNVAGGGTAFEPVPESGTDVGVGDALLVSFAVPCRGPSAVGWKKTSNLFVKPGAMLNGGNGKTASKSPALEIFTPVTVRVAVPVFWIVKVF
jgi:hypothetical protein